MDKQNITLSMLRQMRDKPNTVIASTSPPADKQPLSEQKPVDDPKKEAVCEEETTLYIVRHGETEENVVNILQGHLPGHLTEHGREQARALRDELADRHFDALVCSDLQRCIDTAHILNEPHGLPLSLTPLLRERDWGNLTGISYLKARQQLNNTVESVDALFARAERFLQTLVEQHAGQTVLAVSHGLFSRVVQGAASGKTLREVPRMDNAEVRVVRLKPPLAFRYLKEESGLTAD
ncbi:MAG: histidine phosphatase family protein [Clostridium sp.]|nr:histidine phosphatase family protein [Clostridium sp.]